MEKISVIRRYGFWGTLYLAKCTLFTKLNFRKARLIRLPIDIRGKEFIKVGKGFTTGKYCRIDVTDNETNAGKIIVIGNNVQINDSVHIAASKKVTIGNDVLIASKVFISDHNHGNYGGHAELPQDSPLTKPQQRAPYIKPVTIEDNVWIGEFVSILPGVTIGKGSIIGTMSVVNKDIPAYCIAVGVPAKVIKKFNFENGIWEKI